MPKLRIIPDGNGLGHAYDGVFAMAPREASGIDNHRAEARTRAAGTGSPGYARIALEGGQSWPQPPF